MKGDLPALVVEEEDDEKGAGDGWERWPAPAECEEAGAAGDEAEKEAGVMADVEVGGRGVATGLWYEVFGVAMVGEVCFSGGSQLLYQALLKQELFSRHTSMFDNEIMSRLDLVKNYVLNRGRRSEVKSDE